MMQLRSKSTDVKNFKYFLVVVSCLCLYDVRQVIIQFFYFQGRAKLTQRGCSKVYDVTKRWVRASSWLTGPPSGGEFMLLLCRGELDAVWVFMVERGKDG